MSRPTAVVICACPDLPLEQPALRQRLQEAGWTVHPAPPLCTPAGLMRLQELIRAGAGPLRVGACGPARHQGFFDRLPFAPDLTVVDLFAAPDLEAALAVLQTAPEGVTVAPPPAAVSREVLVVGGGIGGVQAALDLAQAGVKVYLAETSLSIGGTMAQLDKTFPTLDCSICILGPKLVDAATHPLIELLTFAEITGISGQAGDFTVDLRLNPRYVDISRCVGCGSCAEVCPVIVPSRWNLGMKPRKCIRIIFAQAVPLMATIEKEYCIDCRMCVTACERGAVKINSRPESRRLRVGAVVLATGARPFDPGIRGEYGYGRIPGVLTNLEFERLVCATGPTQGQLVTRQGRPVKKIAWVQCVGSRDRRFLNYCSGYCCTASIKQALLALEHVPDAEVTIFFNDLRTSGKGFEELAQRAREAGVRFRRGLPGAIVPDAGGNPVLVCEDQQGGGRRRYPVDLAVLAVGLAPRGEDLPFADGPPGRDELGFYDSRHPILHPLEATLPGVFLAGTCQGPREDRKSVV